MGGPARLSGGLSPDPILRFGIAAQTLAFGLVGVLITLTDAGPAGALGKAITYAVCATTIPASILIGRARFVDQWWTRSSRLNNGFVIYGEFGVTTVLFTFADPDLAIVGATLLALVGVCAAHFCHRYVLRFHVFWSTATVVLLICRALARGVPDPGALVIEGLVVVLVMNGAVFLLSAFSAAILTSSRLHLTDAVTDPLTGLLNRRGIEAHVARRLERGTAPASLVLFDIDDFKKVNDTHGHATGDGVLRRVAMRLAVDAGPGAVVSRFGGEEFVVLIADPHPDLLTYAERLRQSLSEHDDDIPITASAGASPPVTDGPDGNPAFAQTLAAADSALYRAKSNGRDRTELA